MSRAQAEVYFNQGVAFYEERDYGPALEKFETALNLIDPWNTQFREGLCNLIEEVKLCAKDKAQSDYNRSQAAYYRKLAEEAQGRF